MERPTKSQQELLSFIDAFITQHGFGPSYREIQRSLRLKSVSTVAVHIDGLVAKGLLKKHGRTSRSLEVVIAPSQTGSTGKHEAWLIEKIEKYAGNESANPKHFEQIAESCKLLGLKQAEKVARARVAA